MKFKKIAMSALICLSVFNISTVNAEIKNVTATYTYSMGDSETPTVAIQRAVELARRSASEQVAVYIDSYSETSNGKLTEDVIKVVSASIMNDKTAPVIQKSFDDAGGINITATVNVDIDTDQIQSMIQKVNEDREYKNKYLDVLNKYQKLQENMASLNEQLKNTTDEASKKQIKEKIDKNEKEYSANDYFETGLKEYDKNNCSAAIKYFTKAIELNPNHAEAYYSRGYTYSELGNNNEAISDYNKAISIYPDDSYAYNNRGLAYAELGNNKQAISDYNKAIDIDPDNAEAYYNRGTIYSELGKYKQAISDFSEAIDIYPDDAEFYYSRALAYYELEDYDNSLKDVKKALKLDPDNEDTRELKKLLKEW